MNSGPTVAQVARIWHEAGVSTIPILPGGTKRPAVKWGDYQIRLPEFGEMDHWWGNGHEYGLALIMGRISGNLEMLELEGRACDPDSLMAIETAAAELGCLDAWLKLISSAYTEESPNGGLHFIYRIYDREVPGNEKVARRPATMDELHTNPDDRIKVLAETRGEGGYVIVAPTPGICHPTGRQWLKVRGEYGDIVTMYWQTRVNIHRAVRMALDRMPEVLPVPVTPNLPRSVTGTGHLWDEWDQGQHFPTLLRERGWTPAGARSWVRPGKEARDGISATLDHDGSGRLYVFSTSSGVDSDRYYTPFEFVAYSDHGGDIKAALQKLQLLPQRQTIEEFRYTDSSPVDEGTPDAVPADRSYSFSDLGNALRLADRPTVKGLFHWVHEEKGNRYWTGKKWEQDYSGALTREVMDMTEKMVDHGVRLDDEKLAKWGLNSQSASRIQAAMTLAKAIPGMTKRAEEFDRNLWLLNLGNGTLDLKNHELLPHSPQDLITRQFAADYDPSATCPNWERFIGQMLPDEQVRKYVQRVLGYSLASVNDQRALFILHGPSGTGKSTFLETMRAMFGDYGMTAATGAFRAKGKEGGPSPELHTLRGKRFVASSETAETTTFDEELLKRLTGRDRVSSRDLYELPQEWTPECTIWLATNFPPKFNSDDDAIWRRAKLIPLVNSFFGPGEISDMARNILIPEANGILNWLLAGLRDYQESGLMEPETVTTSGKEFRNQSDSVSRFIADTQDIGTLQVVPHGQIRAVELYGMYTLWCKDSGERGLGHRRFMNRLTTALGADVRMDQGHVYGLQRSPTSSILGSFQNFP